MGLLSELWKIQTVKRFRDETIRCDFSKQSQERVQRDYPRYIEEDRKYFLQECDWNADVSRLAAVAKTAQIMIKVCAETALEKRGWNPSTFLYYALEKRVGDGAFYLGVSTNGPLEFAAFPLRGYTLYAMDYVDLWLGWSVSLAARIMGTDGINADISRDMHEVETALSQEGWRYHRT